MFQFFRNSMSPRGYAGENVGVPMFDGEIPGVGDLDFRSCSDASLIQQGISDLPGLDVPEVCTASMMHGPAFIVTEHPPALSSSIKRSAPLLSVEFDSVKRPCVDEPSPSIFSSSDSSLSCLPLDSPIPPKSRKVALPYADCCFDASLASRCRFAVLRSLVL